MSFTVTFFPDRKALSAQSREMTLEQLQGHIAAANAPSKAALGFLKLARFGTVRTSKKCLRHDSNVLAVTGVEGDHDAGTMSLGQAAELLEKAGVEGIFYTSASHTAERPHWRILCPFSHELPPEERFHMTGRLNGVLRGMLAAESFTLSQAFYYGGVNGTTPSIRITEGHPLDTCDELDQVWCGRPARAKANGQDDNPFDWFDEGPADEDELIEAIATGANYHRASLSLLGLWARRGVDRDEAEAALRALFERVPTAKRDERWRDRVTDIGRLAGFVYDREEQKHEDEFSAADQLRRGGTAAADEGAELWPVMTNAAYYGLAGEIVHALQPHSEADPVALLLQALASIGNAVGRRAYYQVEGDRHYTNLFGVIVGDTSKGRKGISGGRIRQIMEIADTAWVDSRIHSGLSSGEGLIWAVRDPITQIERKGKGKDARRVEVVVDAGVTDKRLYILEPEFAGALTVMRREGNTLSRVVRDSWDRGNLASLTKTSPARATGAHISIIGHITADELREQLDRTSMANGYANRFLFMCAKRSNVLAFGGNLSDVVLSRLGTRVAKVIGAVRHETAIDMSRDARREWAGLYPSLSEGEPGLLGAIIGRAEAQVIRLALTYAVIDGMPEIGIAHLQAALAVWRYAEASARYIFGDVIGDPMADAILHALRQAGSEGLGRTQIRDLFGRHRSAERVGQALSTLERRGKATKSVRTTGGRPQTVWIAVMRRSR